MIEVSYNLYKKKGGYTATVDIIDDSGKVLNTEVIDDIDGLTKNVIITRKKVILINDRPLMFALNLYNEKDIKKAVKKAEKKKRGRKKLIK